MRRTPLLSIVLATAFTSPAAAQDAQAEAQIRNALSAAPAEVAAIATVSTFDGTILREGSSDWVCFPDMPDVPNNTPMWLDATWRKVIEAWQNRREPNYEGIGIAYMLQSDMPVSNTDPFATAPTPDNEWIQEGVPHIMVLVSDHEMLKGLPVDPDNGGPWVMWRGTPYAHIMIPTVPRTK
jgi:hypothetical protein